MFTESNKLPCVSINGSNPFDANSSERLRWPGPQNSRAPLTRALQFIREHADGRMSVSDVVGVSGLSRRALEKRFRAGLGRTVLEQIRLSRTDYFARLLVETDMTVTQIGALLGFSDITHLARYFRAAKRMSPSAYRKAFQRCKMDALGGTGDSPVPSGDSPDGMGATL